MDYLELYKLILSSISDNNVSNFQELINLTANDPSIQKYRVENNDTKTINLLINVSKNLIDDGYINGKYILTKSGTIFYFDGLATLGYDFLSTASKPGFKEKIIQVLKEEGVPLNPNSLSKVLFKLFL
ncbi:hypothetical protein JC2156_05620 [Weissella koreensis KCTC 3621]|uniref:hypothetical protein n=1 Tax=Weissella koreensis TaxID=165096 RepID=UPI00026F3EEC|nr:hypothetical protein [Weissella koreensis]EJF33748.1 hypothetical protein JC2156_05620 [Weissella koreensis KCTC 3621]